jgi:raffinose/stachyose/melibiose transport system permease protein
MNKYRKRTLLYDVIGVIVALALFAVPFVFMLFNSLKNRKEANLLKMSIPTEPVWGNYYEIIQANDFQIITAFKNSLSIMVLSVIILVITASMAGYILQRYQGKAKDTFSMIFLLGLMLPPAILPTIWVLQSLHIYKSLFSIVMIEVALQLPFTIMLYRGYMNTIPRELEAAGYIDGCTKWKVFTKIVFPLLKPVTATIVILNAVTIFNDFMNPLYFFPGKDNVTVQLTLYNYMGRFSSSHNLLFANAIVITVPMLILFLIFNKRIVEGMASGSVKG